MTLIFFFGFLFFFFFFRIKQYEKEIETLAGQLADTKDVDVSDQIKKLLDEKKELNSKISEMGHDKRSLEEELTQLEKEGNKLSLELKVF